MKNSSKTNRVDYYISRVGLFVKLKKGLFSQPFSNNKYNVYVLKIFLNHSYYIARFNQDVKKKIARKKNQSGFGNSKRYK